MNATVKRWVIFGAFLVALVLLLSMCYSTSNGASAQTVPQAVQTIDNGGDPVSFTFQADRLATRGGAVCWEITLDHWWKNGIGRVMYWDANTSEWCANSAQTKVTALPYNYCSTKGGFFTYDGCKAQHGSTGYSYMGMHSTWHWHFIINGLNFDRTQELDFKLYANGQVTGTWNWWG